MGNANTPTRGKLTVISGCMFSGKTSRLITHLAAAQGNGLSIAAFKHADDSRYHNTNLASHDGQTFPCIAVENIAALKPQLTDFQLVCIDEAQFFGRELPAICRLALDMGIDVIVAGIDHDAWGRPFPPMPELKAMADAVEPLTTPCAACGRPARFSQRMTPIENDNMVGGEGEYEPRCEHCFKPLTIAAPDY